MLSISRQKSKSVNMLYFSYYVADNGIENVAKMENADNNKVD